MKVTFDTNIFLDVFQIRQPHYDASAQVLSMVSTGSLFGVCPAHGLTTIYYLVRKISSKPDAEQLIDQILRDFEIGNLDLTGWRAARRLSFNDFEDAVVASVARTSESRFIITRDVGDFVGSPVPAVTPMQFLSKFGSSPDLYRQD